MKNINILEDSKVFFENLSTDEFDKLLNRFGFEYEDISNYSYELKSVKKYIQNIKINNYANKNLYLYRNEIKEQKEKSNKKEEYFRTADSKKIFNNIINTRVVLTANKYDTYNVELGAA
ncbi:hypothetical protein [Clostridium tertium]|uniref:hypothetical protein n=1 Tax=Clostridium tertium TaxID=1559 RepID=UPI00356955B1